MTACATCAAGITDTAVVCHGCAQRLGHRLRDAAALWPALQDVVSRQARRGDPTPRAGKPAPAEPIRPGLGDPADDHQRGYPAGLVVDLRASDVADEIRNTVTTWARLIVESAPVVGPACARCRHTTCGRIRHQTRPPADTPGLLRWLADQLGGCRYQPWAGEAWGDLGRAAGRLAPVVDLPAVRTRFPVGPCPEVACDGQVVAIFPADHDRGAYMHCRTCRTQWPAVQWARTGRRILAKMERGRIAA